jgi:C4-dicarboxylate-specific signal transduction histidine kinase
VAVVAVQAAVFVWQVHALAAGRYQPGGASGGLAPVATRLAWVVGLSGVAVAGGLAVLLAAASAGPIRRLARAAEELAEGNTGPLVDDTRKDEFGDVARALAGMSADLQQARAALAEANKTMEQRVDKRAADYKEAHERLRQTQFELVQHEKMSMLGQLAAGMAHEVNTPTAAILNACVDTGEHLKELLSVSTRLDDLPADARACLVECLGRLFERRPTGGETAVRTERRRMERKLREAGHKDSRRMADVLVAYGLGECADDPAARKRLAQPLVLSVLEHALALKVSSDISEASARKIARIVRSLRFYAHDGGGEMSDIDVNESVDNTLVILQNRIKHLAQVRTRFAENLPSVTCGAELLQVWTNILSNACDAIEETRTDGLGLIEIATRLDDGRVVVEISNDGPPIPDVVLKKMFDPFFTTKRIGKGTGLGLSICTGILQRCGGTASARNEPGRVTFEVSLPTTAVHKDPPKHQAERLPVCAAGRE